MFIHEGFDRDHPGEADNVFDKANQDAKGRRRALGVNELPSRSEPLQGELLFSDVQFALQPLGLTSCRLLAS